MEVLLRSNYSQVRPSVSREAVRSGSAAAFECEQAQVARQAAGRDPAGRMPTEVVNRFRKPGEGLQGSRLLDHGFDLKRNPEYPRFPPRSYGRPLIQFQFLLASGTGPMDLNGTKVVDWRCTIIRPPVKCITLHQLTGDPMDTFQQIRERLLGFGPKEMTLSDEEVAQLDREIDQLVASIAQEATAEAADPKLLQLGEIERVLATICFSTELPYSEKQRQLVRNYERWDDLRIRQQCFAWIKTGTFP